MDNLAHLIWHGTAKGYQDKAAFQLSQLNREPNLYSWMYPICGVEKCYTAEHLGAHEPIRLNYPRNVCIYCGRSAYTKDHLLPRSWTGDVKRKFIVTVPACGSCNSLLGATLTWSITERRAICHARIRRKYLRILRTKDQTPESLSEYGPTLRSHIEESLAKKVEVLRMLDWPHDPSFDLRALQRSGIDDPYALSLLVEDNKELRDHAKRVALDC